MRELGVSGWMRAWLSMFSAASLLSAAWLGMASLAGCGSVSDPSGSASDAAPTDAAAGAPDAAAADAAIPADAAIQIVPATCEEPVVCGYAGEIENPADLVAVAGSCETWGDATVDLFRRRTPTFLASRDLSVCPADFPLPSDCLEGKPLCNAALRISVDPGLTGAAETASCNGAQIAAGARFRVRFNMEPPNLGNPRRTAHIHFERACDAACVEGEHRCEANDSCYLDGDVCFACGYGTLEECACRTPDNGVLDDCTECVVSYGDAIYLSQCVGGTCPQDACSTCPCD